MAHVKLRNKKTGGVWMCPDGAVDDYLAKGWEKAPESAQITEPVPADEAEAHEAAKATTKEKS